MRLLPLDIALHVGLRYDGVQFGTLAQFTDLHEPRTSAHGATFYLPVNEVTEMTLLAKWHEVITLFKKEAV